MPNFKEHATTGAVVGAGLNLAWQLRKLRNSTEPPTGFWDTINRINFLELAAFAVVGAAIASLPDIIEPARSPNHRAILHSVSFGGAVAYGAFGKHSKKWEPESRMTIRTAALSYLSHLALDCGTPMGIPFI